MIGRSVSTSLTMKSKNADTRGVRRNAGVVARIRLEFCANILDGRVRG
jgi:hypothetical protein